MVAVGNGSSTLFWDHKWVAATPLIDLATQEVPIEILGATVEDMWEDNVGWKWETFAPYLNQDILKLIEAHELKNDPNLGDLLYWKDGNKGKFSIKSAISIIRNNHELIDEDCWKIIWNAPTQQRIRAFMWLACHDRLMGNANRFKRQMTTDPSCFVCGDSADSTMHILRDCPLARMIWRKLGGPADTAEFYNTPLKQWFKYNLTHEDEPGLPTWAMLFSIAIWWIWRRRNSIVIGHNNEIPIDYGAFIQVRYKEIKRFLENTGEIEVVKRKKKEVNVRWKTPRSGWFVLNTDGAAKGTPGPAGGGAIIRDEGGNLISAISIKLGHCSAFRAECLALARGLELAKDLQIAKLEVQLDNLACTQILQGKEELRNECAHIFKKCCELINAPNWEVKIIHVFREGNRAADWLANQGVHQEERLNFIETIPLELYNILKEDIQGVALPRLVPA